ncbi:MAG: hypothetical protein NC433_07520 [Clostridiales bacterium]|nr:hypothetical protein [Clostridiales bacterium]
MELLALGILQYCYNGKYDGFEVHDVPDIDLKSYFAEVMNEYSDKYDIIYFAHSFGLIEYDVTANDIQVKHIERSAYNRLRYNARLKI